MTLAEARAAKLSSLQTRLAAARLHAQAIYEGAQSYTLDTGQRMTVQKANVTEIEKSIARMEAELDAMLAEDEGLSAGRYMRPAW